MSRRRTCGSAAQAGEEQAVTDPLCARCGATTTDRGHLMAKFLWAPGCPTVAWCGPCFADDALADRAHILRLGIERWLALIAARGPGRVVREGIA